jgi:hypothetical protein
MDEMELLLKWQYIFLDYPQIECYMYFENERISIK